MNKGGSLASVDVGPLGNMGPSVYLGGGEKN